VRAALSDDGEEVGCGNYGQRAVNSKLLPDFSRANKTSIGTGGVQ
jgi:hypothetical protein